MNSVDGNVDDCVGSKPWVERCSSEMLVYVSGGEGKVQFLKICSCKERDSIWTPAAFLLAV